MYKTCRQAIAAVAVGLAPLIYIAGVSAQGYIEMPDTSEVPELEESSMVLDVDVPPLKYRDPDPEGGPRLNVKEFRLQGLVEYPELGITRKGLIEHVEKIRFDIMGEKDLSEFGYTGEEVAQIADLMADIEDNIDDSHVGPVEVQKLVFLIREQRRKRGVTLGMIETVADEITRFYREKGFILAKAYIPEQKVRDGVVTLTLLLGELGEVSVSNGKRVSEGMVRRGFKSHMNKPVTSKRIEEALYLINDIPGLSARSVLSPGNQVGDTHLNVNVSKERWYSGNVRIDNQGSSATSQNRFYTDIFIHNPSGMGDQVYLAMLNAFSPNNNTFGAFRYSSFWGLPRLRTSVGISSNDFVSSANRVNSEDPQFTGESIVKDVSVDYVISRRRVNNMSVGLKYSDIDTDLVTGLIAGSAIQKASLEFKYDLLSQKRRHLYTGYVGLNSIEALDKFSGAESQYSYFNFEFSMLMFPKMPFTSKETRLLLRTSGQYSGQTTSNVTHFAATGAQRARAFSINGFQGEDGLYLGADWFVPLPTSKKSNFFGKKLSEVFVPYFFYDYSYAKVYALGEGSLNFFDADRSARLSDIGLGLKMSYGKLNGNIYFGAVLVDSPSEEEAVNELDQGPVETPRNTVGLEISYSY